MTPAGAQRLGRTGHPDRTEHPDRSERLYKIGEVAEDLGITARTIRYYEERGLLDAPGDRAKGSHRLYTETDIDRLRDLLQLRDFLGLSLEELTELAEVAQTQQCLRDRWDNSTADEERIRIIQTAIPHVERQLELVWARQRRLADFADQLTAKLDRMRRGLQQLTTGDGSAGAPGGRDAGAGTGEHRAARPADQRQPSR